MTDFRICACNFAGFAPIVDSKYTSDVNWGCMIRSSQMLISQVLEFVFLLVLVSIMLCFHFDEVFHLAGFSFSSIRKILEKNNEQGNGTSMQDIALFYL